MGGDDDGGVEPGQQPGEVVLVITVHPARRLVETDRRGRVAEVAEHHGQRQPLLLPPGQVARMAGAERVRIEPGRRQRVIRSLIGDGLVNQVVRGVLQEERNPAGPPHRAPGGVRQARSVPEQGRLAGAVAAHERHPLAGRDPQTQIAEDRRS